MVFDVTVRCGGMLAPPHCDSHTRREAGYPKSVGSLGFRRTSKALARHNAPAPWMRQNLPTRERRTPGVGLYFVQSVVKHRF